MNERVVVPPNGIRLSSLAAPRIVEVVKPAPGQAITLDLDSSHATTLDLSAIANESVKVVHAGPKLIVEFDNQSSIPADPFFDTSGRPLPNLALEFGGVRAMSEAQFSALLAETTGQPAVTDEDKIPPSGASFVDPSIDALPESLRPLTLLGQETHKSFISSSLAGDDSGANPHAQQLNITPVINIPAAGGAATLVFEGGLLASRGPGESAGSHAGSPAFPVTTKPGSISFTSPDGVQSVSLGGHLLSASPQTFTDATGSLTASYTFNAATHAGAITYTYTLLDNTLGVPSASFAVVVTDSDGHTNAPGNLVITIADDAPIARADADNVASGQVTAETGNVLTGAGTVAGPANADVSGADGGVSVVGVAAGNVAGGVNPGSVGVAIAGAFGTLTLNADGSYNYVHAIGGGADVFTYTIKDADGSLAHTTLTLRIPDSTPGNIAIPPAGNPAAGTEVFESGLPARTIAGTAEPAGSHAGNPAFSPATSGTISFTSPDGVAKIDLGGLTLTAAGAAGTFTDATGSLTASYSYDAATGQGIVSYTYTLLDNTLADPSGKSFAIAVTDVDGDRAQGGNLTIVIVDDVPGARADTDSFAAGQLTAETSNVLTGIGTTSGASGADVPGADGAVIAGVAAGNTGVDLVNASTVGVTIAGAFGRLTLNADGSYNYAHTGSSGGGNDVFTYTIRDADGDLSHATLTIAVADSTPGNIVIPPPGNAGAGTEVFEAGLLASRGAGESAGSDAGNPDGNAPTSTSGVIAFTSSDGVSKVELGSLVLTAANLSQTFTDATGSLTALYTYNAATAQGTINYTYTLHDNVLGTPGPSFAVAVTDADGDRSTGGNLIISIADDAPVAHADTDSVAAGQLTGETGNVLTGIGTTSGAAGADVFGADGGVTVVGVDAGSTAGTVNPGALGVAVAGALGTLTLNADGSYNYLRSAGAGGGTDVFTYTIRDADGSLSHATLAIAVTDSIPGNIVIPSAGGAATTVFEAGLLASRGAGESAGSHSGDPAFPTTTQAGTITFTSADGVSKIELGGLTLTAASTPGTFSDATGSLTASYTYNAVTGQGAISYAYTLLDNTLGTPNASFAVAVTDADGDRTVGGNLVISIVDDAPAAHADTDSVAAGQITAETGNVLTGVGTTAGAANADVAGADGGLTVVGVAAGNGTNPANGGLGTAIAGTFGALTLNADGSYSYAHTGSAGGGSDVFTYTVKDTDGSLSTATLTIAVADSTPGNIVIPPPGNAGAGTEVFEAGLLASREAGESAGSDAGNPDGKAPTTTTGTITFTSADGVSKIELGGLTLTAAGTPSTFTDATGSLTASYTYNAATGLGTISYTYTLLDNADSTSVPNKSFAVAVTDGDGDRAQGGNLVISIIDDAPVAHADTDSVAAGQVTVEAGNVLSGVGTTSGAANADVAGADGGLTIIGVAAGAATNPVNGGLGTAIAGTFGTLTLNADGSYDYIRNIGGAGGSHADTFTYTIQDADGSRSSATLTINIANSAPGDIVVPPPDTGETAVFEAGLPARVVGGASEPAGSNPLDPTTTAGTITFTSLDGVQSVELGSLVLHVGDASQTFTNATGQLTAFVTYDPATGSGEINYTYTLLDNADAQTTPSVTFAVAVTDLDGDRSAGNDLVITVVDDAPQAAPDSDAVISGQTTPETGNVITGEGTDGGLNGSGADVPGADGATLVNIAFGGTVVTVDPTSGGTIAGGFGTLTIFSDGSYSYVRTGASGVDNFTYTIQDSDGTQSSSTLTIDIGDSTPRNIVVPPPGGADTTVFEAGLLASRGAGESAGSHGGDPAFPTTTQTGAITFTSADGVSKIELGGLTLTAPGAAETFTDATGSLTASYAYNAATGQGTISYTYTLLDNAVGPSNPSFAVAITDPDGDRTVGASLVIGVVDDSPIAIADTDVVAAGQITAETGNVISGAGTTSGNADIQGADGGVTVIGVTQGDTGGGIVIGDVGTAITGAFGTLTLNADGSYSYAHTGSAGGGTDVFTYAIQDADDSRSVATLTINVGDSTPGSITIPAVGGAATTVFEAGLLASRGAGESAGSDAGNSDGKAPTTTSGTITFTSLDGVSNIELGGLTLTTAGTAGTLSDATGSLTASYTYNAATGQGAVSYSYTLLDNVDSTSVPTKSFAVAVTDGDGDRTQGGNLVIAIADDHPAASGDTATTAAGAASGNVLANDAGGADGLRAAADGGAVVSVAGVNGSAVAGQPLSGTFGTLTLTADGHYDYVRNGVAVPAGGGSDTFTYTIVDGDGTSASAQLVISVTPAPGNITIPGPGVAGAGTLVDEAGLPARGSEPAGSDAASSSETTSGTITFTSAAGISQIELGGLTLKSSNGFTGTLSDATGTLTASLSSFDAQSGSGTVTYAYTLLDNTLGNPLVNNGDTSVSFAVAVTDGNNVRTVAGSNLVITVKDDHPTAHADAADLTDQTQAFGNVLANDVKGADNAVVSSIASAVTPATDVDIVGTTIQGAFGALTIDRSGNYEYDLPLGVPAGFVDTFTYTILDFDGSTSTATLVIGANGISIPIDAAETTVFEAGLPARGSEPAGSDAGNPDGNAPTAASGTIAFTSVSGITQIELGGLTLKSSNGFTGTLSDATGTLTASLSSFDAQSGSGTVTYTYTLLDNTLGNPLVNNGDTSVSFAVAVTDGNNVRTVAGSNLVITLKDDHPTASGDTAATAAGVASGNVLANDAGGADGLRAAADGGAVVSVAGSNGSGVVGQPLSGAFGTLTLTADGHYDYVRNGVAVPASGGSDTFTYTIVDGDGTTASAQLVISIPLGTGPGPIGLPPASQPGVTEVFEAGLAARGSEPAGSDAGNTDGQAPVTATGSITFSAPDGLHTITLGGNLVTATTQAQAQQTPFADGTRGQLVAWSTVDGAGSGTLNYIYTLLDNVTNTADAPLNVSFAVAVTDDDGRTASSNLVIAIADDHPTAKADTDSVAAGQITAEAGNVLDGTGTTSGPASADISGADGGITVVRVDSQFNESTVGRAVIVDPTLGATIQGDEGTLTILANGSYSYAHTGRPGGAPDQFTYTISDSDGSVSTASLTFTVADSAPGNFVIPPAGSVFEAGLLASRGSGESPGTDAGNPDGRAPTTMSGAFIFTSLDGIASITLTDAAKTGNRIVLDSAHPSLTILDPGYSLTASFSYDSAIGQGTVNYSYTLLDNTVGISNTTFMATVQDRDGDSGTGNLVVNIVDDAPVANADTDFLALGSIAKVGNVVTGTGTTSGASGIDVAGADGGLQVVGVAAGNTGLDLVDLSTVGAEIHGSFGTLTLAGGPYLYERDPGPQPGGIPDVFTYTVRDADGSLSHTTLGVTLADSAPSITSATTGTLFEAGLDARGNEPAGTHAGDFLNFPTIATVTISFASIDGVQSVTMDGATLGPLGGATFTADADPNTGQVIGEKEAGFSYDPTTRTGTISVLYHLTDNTNAGITPSRSPNIVVTDLDGDTVSIKATFNIVDDAPIAVEDDIPVRTTASGNLTGNDITGADGFGSVIVVGVEANNTNRNHHGGVGSDINGRFGVLTVQEDGSFTYFNSSGQPTGVDLFTYTIQDSDGALSHALIAVSLGQSSGGVVVENRLLSQDHQLTSGSDFITGSGGLDNNFVASSSGQVNSGDSIHGSGEAETTDTLNLVAAGTYNLTKVDITNVESIVLGSNLGDGGNENASGNFNVTVGDAAVSTADFNKDGLGGDLQISAAASTSNGAVIDASSLTGSNHIVVDGTNLNGDNTFKGGAGADILTGGNGNDVLAGGGGIDTLKGSGGANHFAFNAPGEGGDHILDFKHGSDSIDILLANFAGLSGKGAVANSDFVTSNNAANVNLGSAHFAYSASSGQLFYDSNGGDASGASRILLAVFDNHAALAATDIHKV